MAAGRWPRTVCTRTTSIVGRRCCSSTTAARRPPPKMAGRRSFSTSARTCDTLVVGVCYEAGCAGMRLIIKTDQEASVKALIEDVVAQREEGRTIVEESPVQSSGSNGVVERAVQEVEARIRAIFLAFQERLGRRIDARERIVAFIPEYAAYLMNRLNQGSDGKVPYERIKGKNG